MELKSKLKDEFEHSVQVYTCCEICGNGTWCVMHDNGKELCEDCYLL